MRSAAFGLGFLQSLYSRGVLRFVDYLSTVSGGSYVGSFLATLASDPQSGMVWDRTAGPGASAGHGESTRRDRTFDFDQDDQGRQPALVRRLIAGGNYLRRPGSLFAHWLPGFVAVNLVGMSLLVCTCALFAWIYRYPDTRSVVHWLRYFGFSDDVMRAFAPTALLLVAWICVSVGGAARAFFRRGTTGARRAGISGPRKVLTIALLISSVLSAVSLLGLGNIDTSAIQERFQIDLSSGVKESFSRAISTALYALVAIGILPYINPWAMLRSGTNPKRPRDRYLFHVATYALGCGLPLVGFLVLSSENISFSNRSRENRSLLTLVSFQDWDEFWSLIVETSEQGAGKAKGRLASTEGAAGNTAGRPNEAAPMERQTGDGDRNSEKKGGASVREQVLVKLREKLDATFKSIPPGWLKKNGDSAGQATPVTLAEFLQSRAPDAASVQRVRDESLFQRWKTIVGLGADRDAGLREFVRSSSDTDVRGEMLLAIANRAWLYDEKLYEAFEDGGTLFEESTAAGEGEKPGLRRATARLHDLVMRAKTMDRPFEPTGKAPGSEMRWRDKSRAEMNGAVLRGAIALEGSFEPRRELVVELERNERDSSEIAEWQTSQADRYRKKLREVNRAMLQMYFGEKLLFDEDSQIFAYNVQPADQSARLQIAVASLAVFVVVGGLVNLNGTSLHGFYRDCLSSQWIMKARQGEMHDLRLSDVDATSEGAPYLLINGALTMMGRSGSQTVVNTEGFLLSPRWLGAESLGFMRTEDSSGDELTLGDAMAVSGGAVTPTVSRNLAVRALLWLGNFRLGQWLPNPATVGRGERPWVFMRPLWRRPSPLFLLRSWLFLPQGERDFQFVSDGGLHENLGVEALLRRRCRLIIAVDAGVDPEAQFSDFVKLLFRMRVEEGIEFTNVDGTSRLDLQSLESRRERQRPQTDRRLVTDRADGGGCDSPADGCADAERHFVVLKVKYPQERRKASANDRSSPVRDEDGGYLIFVRPSFDGDEPDELRTYRKQNSEFPQDATVDQFFEPERFEAYRFLGHHVGMAVAARFHVEGRNCEFRVEPDDGGGSGGGGEGGPEWAFEEKEKLAE